MISKLDSYFIAMMLIAMFLCGGVLGCVVGAAAQAQENVDVQANLDQCEEDLNEFLPEKDGE